MNLVKFYVSGIDNTMVGLVATNITYFGIHKASGGTTPPNPMTRTGFHCILVACFWPFALYMVGKELVTSNSWSERKECLLDQLAYSTRQDTKYPFLKLWKKQCPDMNAVLEK